ncbi:SP_0009 family protein [Streptococcus vestibularis]|nr:SP_0009 family protein [Streptococcus vestibularis]
MKDLLKTIETFLTYSEAKLEALSEKNQQLKTDVQRKEEVKKQA